MNNKESLISFKCRNDRRYKNIYKFLAIFGYTLDDIEAFNNLEHDNGAKYLVYIPNHFDDNSNKYYDEVFLYDKSDIVTNLPNITLEERYILDIDENKQVKFVVSDIEFEDLQSFNASDGTYDDISDEPQNKQVDLSDYRLQQVCNMSEGQEGYVCNYDVQLDVKGHIYLDRYGYIVDVNKLYDSEYNKQINKDYIKIKCVVPNEEYCLLLQDGNKLITACQDNFYENSKLREDYIEIKKVEKIS